MAAARPKPKATDKSTGKTAAPKTRWWVAIPLSILSGCMVFLSFPTWNIFPLQWIALVPLFVALRGHSPRGAFVLGYISGVVTNIGGFHWIYDLLLDFGHMSPAPSIAITILMGLYQGLTTGFAASFAVKVHRDVKIPMWLAYPILFTAIEYAVPFLFPWYQGNGQQRFTAITQIVDITGVPGLTFLILLVNGAIGEVINSRLDKRTFPFIAVPLALIAFIAALVYGVIRLSEIDTKAAAAKKIKVGLVESDIGIWEQEIRLPDGSHLDSVSQINLLFSHLLRHQYMSADLQAKHAPDLIIWPESSYMPLNQVLWYRSDRRGIASSQKGELFFIDHNDLVPVVETGANAPDGLGLKAVAASSEDHMVAVGPRGSVFIREDAEEVRWARENTKTDRDLTAVAISPDGLEIMAVGNQGTAVFRQNGDWRLVELGTTANLNGVTWTQDHGWVVCGENGTLLTWFGKDAAKIGPDDLPDLYDVSWSRQGGLVAVGAKGTIVKIKRNGESTVENPVNGKLLGVSSSGITMAVGERGIVVACNETCKVVRSKTSEDLVAITMDPGGYDGWAVAKDGTLLLINPSSGTVEEAIETGKKGLNSIAWAPMSVGYPFPRDVKAIYTSRAPLPAVGTAEKPEAAVEFDKSNTPHRDKNAAMRGFTTPLLFGTLTKDLDSNGNPRHFNSALLIDSRGNVLGRYDKIFLLLFGEYLPFSNTFPFLKDLLPEAGDFKAGTELGVFDLGDANAGMLICYEGIIPSFTRKVAKLEPDLLINLTNDAWFGKTMEPYLHLQLATFRAIEHRKAMIRSTNTGVTAVVDPAGRLVQQTSIYDPETIVADIPLMQEPTIYRKYGELFAWACCGLSVLLVGLAMILGRRKQ
jgi:apolipoprotein N-acyltransferase